MSIQTRIRKLHIQASGFIIKIIIESRQIMSQTMKPAINVTF